MRDGRPAPYLWRKSTKSSHAGCVEVRFVDESVELRNSRDPNGPVLVFTTTEWDAFLAGAQEREFDVPVR